MKQALIKLIAIIFFSITFQVMAAPNDDYGVVDKPKHKLYQLALTAIDQKNYINAVAHLNLLSKEQSDNADAFNLLGYSHRKLKQYAVAERFYKRALTIDPEHKGALEYLGELYVETNRFDLARQQLSKLDQVCWFSCKEYRLLKRRLDEATASY